MYDRPPNIGPEGRPGPGSTVPIDSSTMSGKSLGPFLLRERIGVGGMGEVWKAEQTSPIRRTVALKLIKAGMDSREVLARFEAERQALAVMDHPYIAKVFDAGTTPQGRPWFAMEYVHGIRITEYCDQRFMATQDRLRLFQRVCEAVHHAHQKAILHRDLKPSNILVADLDGKPRPKIIDFGVAKATAFKLTEETMYTAMGQLVGTPEYMSPEQADLTSEDVDTRSDVYSLGVILYELLTAALPFDRAQFRNRGLAGIVHVLRDQEPLRPSTRVSTLDEEREEIARRRQTGFRQLVASLQGDLDWIVMRCLEKDRNRRYGSALELSRDLQRHLDHVPVEARPPSITYRAGKFARRHKLGVGITLATLAFLVAFSVTTAIQATRIAAERDRASREAAVSSEVTDFLVQLFEISDPRESRGNTITARELLDRGAGRVQEEEWTDPRIQSRLVTVMGEVYNGLGLIQEARPLYEQALHLNERTLGRDDPATLESLFNVGMAAFRTGDYDSADSILRDVRERRSVVLGPEHPDTAEATRALAHLLRNRGRRDEAEPLYDEALALQRKILGKEDPATANTENQLGILYWSQGRYAEAEPLLVHSLAATEKAYGPDDPLTLTFRNNMAAFEQTATHWADLEPHRARAEELYRECIEAQRRILGSEHPETLRTIYNLGSLLVAQDRLDEAEPLLREAARGRELALGPNHRATLMAQTDIAYLLRQRGRSREAEALLREILDRQRQVLEPSHREIRQTLDNLFELLVEEGRREDARPVLEDLLVILEHDAGREQASAEAHDRYARMLATCALEEYRDAGLAVAHARQAVEMSGRTNPQYLLTLARAQSLSGDDVEAYATITSALSLLPPEDEDRAEFEEEQERFASRGGSR